jgi:phage-related protein
MERIVAFAGQKFQIVYGVEKNGCSPALEFVSQLGVSDQAKLFALFRRLGDTGNFMNQQKFRDLGDGLFEFKSYQIRVLFAYCKVARAVVVLTNGFIKKQDGTPKEEIERARRIFAEDQARLKPPGPMLVKRAGK